MERADWALGAEYGVSLLKEAGNCITEMTVNSLSQPFSPLTPMEANEQQELKEQLPFFQNTQGEAERWPLAMGR